MVFIVVNLRNSYFNNQKLIISITQNICGFSTASASTCDENHSKRHPTECTNFLGHSNRPFRNHHCDTHFPILKGWSRPPSSASFHTHKQNLLQHILGPFSWSYMTSSLPHIFIIRNIKMWMVFPQDLHIADLTCISPGHLPINVSNARLDMQYSLVRF